MVLGRPLGRGLASKCCSSSKRSLQKSGLNTGKAKIRSPEKRLHGNISLMLHPIHFLLVEYLEGFFSLVTATDIQDIGNYIDILETKTQLFFTLPWYHF